MLADETEVDGASGGGETWAIGAGIGLANGKAGVKECAEAIDRRIEVASAGTVPSRLVSLALLPWLLMNIPPSTEPPGLLLR